jgi:hypothetical protein
MPMMFRYTTTTGSVYIYAQAGPLTVQKQEALFSRQLSKFKTGAYSGMKSCVSARKVRSAHTIVPRASLQRFFVHACVLLLDIASVYTFKELMYK